MDFAHFSEDRWPPAGKCFEGTRGWFALRRCSRGAGSRSRVYACCYLHQGLGGRRRSSQAVEGTVPGPARSRFLPRFTDLRNCEISNAGGGFLHRNRQMGQKTGEQDRFLTLPGKHSLFHSWYGSAFSFRKVPCFSNWDPHVDRRTSNGREGIEKIEIRNTTTKIISHCLNCSNSKF